MTPQKPSRLRRLIMSALALFALWLMGLGAAPTAAQTAVDEDTPAFTG